MYPKEFVQKIIDLRRSGMPRKEIAKLVGLSGSKVKYILQHNKVYLTQEQLIKNLTLAQTPEVMAARNKTMLEVKKNDPDFVKRRNLKIKEAWSNPEVLKKQSQRSKKNWEDPEYAELISIKVKEAFNTPEAKAKLSAAHKGKISPNNAIYTFQEIYDVCKKLGLKFLDYQDPDKMLFKSKNAENTWPIECECGVIIYPDLNCLIKREVPKSCGCKRGIAENEVRIYVKGLSNTVLDTETFDVIPPFALDVCDPINKIALEYCGLHWHNSDFKSNTYHLNKLLMCDKIGYRLITIFEDEWLSRRTQVEGFIKAIFKKNELMKVDARKLKIEKATKEEARSFTNENHIQVYTECPVNYKLIDHEGLIVALASFSNRLSSRTPETGTWELHRYAVKIGLNVRGGFGKILKHFKEDFKPLKLVTYSDNRWSKGNLYKSVGFTETSTSRPSYWYFKKNYGDQRYHKSLFTKDRIASRFPEIYNVSKKESEMMKEAGYKRIYDCGKIKWELIF